MKLAQLLEARGSSYNQRPAVLYYEYEQAIIDPNDPDADYPAHRTLNIKATVCSNYDESGEFEEFELISMNVADTGEKVTEVTDKEYEEIQKLAFEQ